jgi:SAM-dependent methyltransferase
MEKPRYATWVRRRMLVYFWCMGLIPVLSGVVLGDMAHWACYAICLLGLPLLYIAVLISLVAWRFGPLGGDWQGKIHGLLVEAAGTDARGLDIGCGGGRLIIQIAKRNPQAHLGIDYWGQEWEYSMAQCERNARLEGVGNVEFRKASASALPLEGGSFGAVVSCMTFHEVRDVEDKTLCLREALRVLAPGGRFALIDLFNDPKRYPDRTRVAKAIDESGCALEFDRSLAEVFPLPFPLRHPQALRYAALLKGRKA